jgi:predicted nucleic acid-binding protein
MDRYLFDTNVLLDLLTADRQWISWSLQRFTEAAEKKAVYINPIIYAELAASFKSQELLDAWLTPTIFNRLPLPFEAGFCTGQAFLDYRRRGGTKTAPLPDFYIGAHALAEDLVLVTRDVGRYKSYFPALRIISPSSSATVI